MLTLGEKRQEHLRLAWDLARRDLAAKYKRSLIGAVWLVLTPLCLLGIYWLVFGLVFNVQWPAAGAAGGESVGFILPFFVGLTVYLTLSDVVNSSTTLFASKRTYVVKSPFPIWVLWLANLLRAGVHGAVAFLLVLTVALLQGRLSGSALGWILLSALLCLCFMAALSLLLAALGPFIGDISDAMRLLLRVLFYATPITYPLTMVPLPYREWMWLNPLTAMVELLRAPIVFASMPDPSLVAGFTLGTAVLLAGAAWIFGRVKGVISDVV